MATTIAKVNTFAQLWNKQIITRHVMQNKKSNISTIKSDILQ